MVEFGCSSIYVIEVPLLRLPPTSWLKLGSVLVRYCFAAVLPHIKNSFPLLPISSKLIHHLVPVITLLEMKAESQSHRSVSIICSNLTLVHFKALQNAIRHPYFTTNLLLQKSLWVPICLLLLKKASSRFSATVPFFQLEEVTSAT